MKDVRNLFRLEKLKKTINTTIKSLRNLFKLEKENEEVKDRIIRDIRKFLNYKKKVTDLKIDYMPCEYTKTLEFN